MVSAGAIKKTSFYSIVVTPLLFPILGTLSMQKRESDISLIFSAQPDIYIFLKLIWHHCFCSWVKVQRNEGAHKDGWGSYINCTKIIQFPSELTATGKQPPRVPDCQQLLLNYFSQLR